MGGVRGGERFPIYLISVPIYVHNVARNDHRRRVVRASLVPLVYGRKARDAVQAIVVN